MSIPGGAYSSNLSHIGSGNRCGHNPLSPNWFTPPKAHGRRYDSIRWGQENVKRYYGNSQKWLASMRRSRESHRQQRSEGRERDGVIIQILLHHCELASLRVGTPHLDGSFDSLSMKDLALRAGWRSLEDDRSEHQRDRNRGIKRVWRALTDLKEAGYITIHECVEKIPEGEEDQYRSLPAIKCIQPKFFWELGITKQKLNADRALASKRLKRKRLAYQQKISNTEPVQLNELARHIVKKPVPFGSQARREFYALKREEAARARYEGQYRQKYPELYALREQYPHLTPDELLAMAKSSPPVRGSH